MENMEVDSSPKPLGTREYIKLNIKFWLHWKATNVLPWYPWIKAKVRPRIITQYMLATGNIGGRMKSIFAILVLLLTTFKKFST